MLVDNSRPLSLWCNETVRGGKDVFSQEFGLTKSLRNMDLKPLCVHVSCDIASLLFPEKMRCLWWKLEQFVSLPFTSVSLGWIHELLGTDMHYCFPQWLLGSTTRGCQCLKLLKATNSGFKSLLSATFYLASVVTGYFAWSDFRFQILLILLLSGKIFGSQNCEFGESWKLSSVTHCRGCKRIHST